MSQKTITINGRLYDAHTGMPVENTKPTAQKPTHSQTVHHTPQRSHTLNRRAVKASAPVTAPGQSANPQRADIRRSPAITRFAPRQANPPVSAKRPAMDIAPHRPHAAAVKANQHIQQKKAAVVTPATHALKPSEVIKNEAIADAMAKAPTKKQIEAQRTKGHRKLRSRFLSMASAGLALLLLGGYFTYLNMPNLSVRVAAAQAGIDASYPDYKPDGYSLNGAVAYSQGQVSMKFASNGGPQSYTIDQSKSNWDSSAVLDNYVKKKAGSNYTTYNERGLTIYTFNDNAAWVNGGILYTIEGDAPLSTDQIRRIATSM